MNLNFRARLKKGDLLMGIFCDSAESAAPYIRQGYALIAISTECLHMAQSARATLKAAKGW